MSVLKFLSRLFDFMLFFLDDEPGPSFGSLRDMERDRRSHIDSNLFETHSDLGSSTGWRSIDRSCIKAHYTSHHEGSTR